MKLTKGQLSTLRRLQCEPENYSDEALKLFFNYTDRGKKPPIEDEWELTIWPSVIKPLGYQITDKGIIYSYSDVDLEFLDLFGRFKQSNWKGIG